MALRRIKYKRTLPLIYIGLLSIVCIAMFFIRSKGLTILLNPASIQSDTLKVAILNSSLSYAIYSDTIGGLDYDLIRDYARDRKLKLRIIPAPSAENALAMLDSGQADIVASITSDNPLAGLYSLTYPIYLQRSLLIQSNAHSNIPKISSILNLAGRQVHIKSGSQAELRLREVNLFDTLNIIRHDTLSEKQILKNVLDGTFPLALVTENSLVSQPDVLHGLYYNSPVSFTQSYCWAVANKDSVLFSDLQDWLYAYKNSDRYTIYIDRYIHPLLIN